MGAELHVDDERRAGRNLHWGIRPRRDSDDLAVLGKMGHRAGLAYEQLAARGRQARRNVVGGRFRFEA